MVRVFLCLTSTLALTLGLACPHVHDRCRVQAQGEGFAVSGTDDQGQRKKQPAERIDVGHGRLRLTPLILSYPTDFSEDTSDTTE